MRTLLSTLLPFLLLAAPAAAQEQTPAPADTATAAPATPPPAPRTPAKPAAVPKPSAPPAPPAPVVSPPDVDAVLALTAQVDELRAAIEYHGARAARLEARGPIADAQRDEIRRARERAADHVRVQLARVEKALAEVHARKAGSEDVLEEVGELVELSERGSTSIREVLTYDDRTEATLQEIADCYEEISVAAESVVAKLEETLTQDERDRLEVTFDSESGTVRISAGSGDRVSYGKMVVVAESETVRDAVAFGEDVSVLGHVTGDAVAFGGDLRVAKTGRVDGDAAAFGGSVIVEEGGTVSGEQLSFGPGAILGAFRIGSGDGLVDPEGDDPPPPLPARIGMGMLTAGAQFLCFFLLGLLLLAAAPRRTEVVARELAAHPIKAGGVGILAMFAGPPLTVLLCITVIGILFVPLFWALYFAAMFVGFVALALVIGRKLPTKVVPTNTALLAIGAAVFVAAAAVLPWWLEIPAWTLLGCFALGSAVMTKFGDEPEPPAPMTNDLATLA